MLKLRVKTLPFDTKLTRFQSTSGVEILLGIPLCLKYLFNDCSMDWIAQSVEQCTSDAKVVSSNLTPVISLVVRY